MARSAIWRAVNCRPYGSTLSWQCRWIGSVAASTIAARTKTATAITRVSGATVTMTTGITPTGATGTIVGNPIEAAVDVDDDRYWRKADLGPEVAKPQPIKSGVEYLDAMFGGGQEFGTTTLVIGQSGPPVSVPPRTCDECD